MRLKKPEFDCTKLDETYDCGCGPEGANSTSIVQPTGECRSEYHAMALTLCLSEERGGQGRAHGSSIDQGRNRLIDIFYIFGAVMLFALRLVDTCLGTPNGPVAQPDTDRARSGHGPRPLAWVWINTLIIFSRRRARLVEQKGLTAWGDVGNRLGD